MDWAQAGGGAPTSGGPASGGTGQFIMGTVQFFALGLFVYYMLVILPKNAQENDHKKFLETLSKYAEVMTVGGLFGKVVSVAAYAVTVELAPNVKIRVHPKYLKAKDAVVKAQAPVKEENSSSKEQVSSAKSGK